MRCLKLPFRFDPRRLCEDLARIHDEEWIPHVNRQHYDGQWSGAPLRSIGGKADNINPDVSDASAFSETALLHRCAYFRQVLATFQCPLLSARLLRLHVGSNIAEHVDHALDFEDGEVRLHVPIVTHDAVRFFLDGCRLVMAPGECWYTNVNLPHSVENQSPVDRIHLVIDCQVNEWLRRLFASTPRPAADHYLASLSLPKAPAISHLLEALSEFAALSGRAAQFKVERNSFILQWQARHAWQIRLRPQTDVEGWAVHLESSPDPEQSHRQDTDAVIEILRHRLPQLEVRHYGL